MISIYIHIPFCNSICTYCDFPKQIASNEKKDKYINYLISEIEKNKDKLKNVRSVYIGGGTPNSLSNQQLEALFASIGPYLSESKENTIEVNPELLTLDQVLLFRKYNINRISIGVQTTNNLLINNINRHHNKEMVINAIKLLRENHIQNINLDMIYGLPGQTIEEINDDLTFVLEQNVPHLSYYSLILEDRTILDYQIKHNQISIPDDDLVADMSEYITQKLKMSQLKQYEISNYSKPGYESIHNLTYWNYDNYIGFGSSAASLINNRRYQNAISLNKYYQNELFEDVYLNLFEEKQEYMMLGLRKLHGININDYYNRFKSYPNEDFDIDKLIKMDLIIVKNNNIYIKEDKLLLANIIFEEFVG